MNPLPLFVEGWTATPTLSTVAAVAATSPRVITTSQYRCYRSCARNHLYAYTLGYRPVVEADALRFGTLFHRALEAWWKAEGDRLEAGLAALACAADIDAFDLAKARALLLGYHALWIGESLEVLAVEVRFETPLVNPATGAPSKTWRLGGKIDAIVRDLRDGRVLIVEHKCLTGASLIFDYGRGKLCRVDELFTLGIGPLVLAYDEETGRLVQAQALPPRAESVRDVYEVALASGRRLRVSDNHPILTARGWIEAASLRTDDRVAIPASSAGWNGPTEFSDDEVRLVGYMLGDGTMSGLAFCKSDDAVLQDFVRTIERLGYREGASGPGYRVVFDDRKAPSVRLSHAESSPARRLLERLGVRNHVAASKLIPRDLQDIPDRQVGILIGALWSTDGCVDTYRETREGRRGVQLKPRIAYVSRSGALCSGVQRLLLRLGIRSSVTRSSVAYRGARRDVFTVRVTGRAAKRRFLTMTLYGRIAMVKYPDRVREALAALKPGDDPREGCDSVLPPEAEVTWDRVQSVAVTGREMMYDLTVPGFHTFVVDDVITHNTSSEDISSGSDYWKRLRLDAQVGTYYVGAKALGYDVAGCLYDVIKKPGLRPLKATPLESRKYTKDGAIYANQRERDEAPDEYAARLAADIAEKPATYYARGEVVRLEQDIRDHFADAWALGRQIREAELAERWPRNPDACVRWGRTCEFFPVCTGEASLDDATRYRRVSHVHLELKENA